MLFDDSMIKNLIRSDEKMRANNKGWIYIIILLSGFCTSGMAQTKVGLARLFQNDRLKLLSLPDRPVGGDSLYRVVEGVWVSESSDPEKALVFPEQVKISCENYGADDMQCVELSVSLALNKNSVIISELKTVEYAIDRWDGKGLIASYGGNEKDPDSKCQRHVLTMDFESGAVSVSDIPTHMKGCEAFTTTNSYRLVRGEYYVDTTPNNDQDKPVHKTK